LEFLFDRESVVFETVAERKAAAAVNALQIEAGRESGTAIWSGTAHALTINHMPALRSPSKEEAIVLTRGASK
jgi:hypothetical protein